MNQAVNQAVDGDDYTDDWRSGGAVLKREGLNTFDRVTIDLRTPDQKAAAEMAELRGEIDRLRDLVALVVAPLDVALRVDNLVDALAALARRVQQLEQAK